MYSSLWENLRNSSWSIFAPADIHSHHSGLSLRPSFSWASPNTVRRRRENSARTKRSQEGGMWEQRWRQPRVMSPVIHRSKSQGAAASAPSSEVTRGAKDRDHQGINVRSLEAVYRWSTAKSRSESGQISTEPIRHESQNSNQNRNNLSSRWRENLMGHGVVMDNRNTSVDH